jgi:acetyltransferase-like isoleucine patch superfamily enzyme
MSGPQVHPRALVESDDVGAGTRIWAFAHIMAGAHVGAGCNVGDHAFIESGVTVGDRVTIKNGVMLWDGVVIEDEVFIGPNATFTNDLIPRAHNANFTLVPTTVRRGASIGASATILCGVTIGEHAMVGAGAVVTADVPSHALVAGNPGRKIGWSCVCGRRLGDDLTCPCGRRYTQDGPGLRAL